MIILYPVTIILLLSNISVLPRQNLRHDNGHSLGGDCGHIKAYGLDYSHIKGNSKLKACWADMP